VSLYQRPQKKFSVTPLPRSITIGLWHIVRARAVSPSKVTAVFEIMCWWPAKVGIAISRNWRTSATLPAAPPISE